MPTEENPHAGTGSVVLDIGGDIGALVVVMPAEMNGLEVEIIPTGTDGRPPALIGTGGPSGQAHDNDHAHDHDHDDTHAQDHTHDHDAGIAPLPPHVAVVGRPTPGGAVVHSLVYGSLTEGSYDLYVRPYGPVHLTVSVVGGQVTETAWT